MSTPEADRIVGQVLGGQTEAYVEIVRLYQRDVWRVVAALLRDVHQTGPLRGRSRLRGVDQVDRPQPRARGAPPA
jgi:hypothetical protein